MVVESEVLKAQSCALSKFSLPMHSNVFFFFKRIIQSRGETKVFPPKMKGRTASLIATALPCFQSMRMITSEANATQKTTEQHSTQEFVMNLGKLVKNKSPMKSGRNN